MLRRISALTCGVGASAYCQNSQSMNLTGTSEVPKECKIASYFANNN